MATPGTLTDTPFGFGIAPRFSAMAPACKRTAMVFSVICYPDRGWEYVIPEDSEVGLFFPLITLTTSITGCSLVNTWSQQRPTAQISCH